MFNKISEYSDEEIKKLKVPKSYFSPKDHKYFNNMLKQIIKKGYGRIEVDFLSKSGKSIPTEYYTSVICNKQKKPTHIIAIGRDITKRKKNENELSDYREHLENMVLDRTQELINKNAELEEFNQLFVGREFRIKELKDKISDLESKIKELKQY